MASQIITLKDADRFRTKSSRDEESGCLVWLGFAFPSGYGAFKVGRKTMRAHRVAWMIALGGIPTGAFVLHACDNRACVEPAHLFIGDHRSNMADMVAKGRAASGAANGARLRGTTKLTEEKVRAIRADLSAGKTQRYTAAKFGVCQANVSFIHTGANWAHVK